MVDLDRETSGISTAVREAAAFSVFDADASPIVNKRLNAIVHVKSCAFVPIIAADEVIGVVFAAVRKPRVFAEDELALMQSFAAEAGLALERVGSAAALEEALERERLIARFSLELRSQHDLDELLRVAVTEIANAVGVVRCFIRLGIFLREAEHVDEILADGPIDVHAPADAEQVLFGGGEILVGSLSAPVDHLLDDFFPLRARTAGGENAVRGMARAAHALERQRRFVLGFLSARSHRGARNDRQTSHEYRGRHPDRT